MPGNVFSASPLANALAQGEQRRKARSLALNPSAQIGQADNDPDPIAGASMRTQVPVNILESISELSGAAPEHRGEIANRAADMLAERLSQGMSMRDAVSGLSDRASPEFADAILGRAKEIADTKYPTAPAPAAPAAAEAPPEERGMVETILDPFGTTAELGRGIKRGAISSVGAAARALGADETADSMAASAAQTPAAVGSWRDIGSLQDLGKYVYGGIGESVPEMGAVAGTALAATVAGAPALAVGGTALAASALFNTGRNIERQEEETGQRNRMKAIGAGIAQGVLDTIVPGKVGTVVGSALKNRITGAVVNIAARSGERAVGRLTKTAATEAVTEALQQAIEIGQADPDLFRVMLNPQGEEEMAKADSLLDEFINSALLGGAAGGVFGTAEVAATPRPKAEEPPAPEPEPQVLLGPSTMITPPPSAYETESPPEKPSGPLERAVGQGPAPLAPDMDPGAEITIETADAGAIDAVVVSESPTGLRVRADGADMEIPREEIESGAVMIAPRGAAAPVEEAPAQTIETESPPAPEMIEGGLADQAAPAGPTMAPEGPDAADPAAIRQRLDFLHSQAKGAGWNKRLMEERARLEAQLAELEPSPATVEVAPEAPGGSLPVAPEAGVPVTASEEGGAADAGPFAPPAIPETPQVQPAADPAIAPVVVGEGAAAGAAAPALSVEPIREKAAIIRGAGPDAPPVSIPGVSLKWDARAGGWIFSRKHVEKVQAALTGAAAPVSETPKSEHVAAVRSEGFGTTEEIGLKPSETRDEAPSEAPKEITPSTTKPAAKPDSPRAKREAKEKATAASRIAARNAMLPKGYRIDYNGEKHLILYGPTGEIVQTVAAGFETMPSQQQAKALEGAQNRAMNHHARAIPKTPGREDTEAKTSTPAEIKAEVKNVEMSPTDGQKDAGNYQMGHIKVHGLDVTIETPAGATRSGKAPDGTEWSVKMPAHYGYIRRTEGADGDHVDVYVGRNPEHPRAFIVDQFDPKTDRFDEHKVILGAITEEQAKAIYDAGFSDGSGPSRRKAIGEYSVEGFGLWLRNGDQSKPAAWRTLGRDAALTKSIVGAERQPSGKLGSAAARPAGVAIVIDPAKGTVTANPISSGRKGSDAALAGHSTDVPPDGWGAKNKLVTADRAAELRAKLKAKLRDQLNSGIDPEILTIGGELAVFHIEAGARKFAAFAKAIADDLGTTPEKLKPYLRAWYGGAKAMLEDGDEEHPAAAEMDDEATQKAFVKALAAAPSPEPSNPDTVEAPAPEEATDGVQDPLPESDAAAGADDVQGTPGKGATRRASGGKGGRGKGAVRASDKGRAEAAERPAAEPAEGGSGADRDGNPDRVPVLGDLAQNHVIQPRGLSEARGWKAKANDNITAIRTMRRIEAEGRPATPSEQEELARYVGWGGLASVFPDDANSGAIGKGYEGVAAELRELLSDQEYATARRTTQYAHYTGETVVRAMWDAAKHLGFTGGKVFEPGMGTGNFPGMMPADLAAASSYHGLELDPTTARIAKLLYPKWGVRADDFTRAPLPENSYDLVIGNPPFADIPIKSDPKYPQGFLLHDYFFAKSLDAVRPGGLLMFVTSAGTLNKADTKAREYLSKKAHFVGAVRLPGDAFSKNAGTEVTTDIIILRKRFQSEPALMDSAAELSWVETATATLKDKNGNDKTGAVSRYFVEHPDMVLGEEGFFDKLYAGRYGVRSRPGANLSGELPVALAKLPADVMKPWDGPEERAEVDFASTERKEGSYYLTADGKLMQHRSGVGHEIARRGKGVEGGKTAAEIETITALIPVRDALRAVYAADMAGDAENGEKARRRLNRAYDVFTQARGPINKAELSYRRPSGVQAENAREEAREEARYAGTPFREGSFDPESLRKREVTDGVEFLGERPSIQAIARARKAAREEAEAEGRPWDEGDFDPADMPDVVIDKRPNIDPFADDPENYRLRAIESYDDATGEGAKTDVFYRNIVSRAAEPEINSVEDAVLYVLNQMGRFDIEAVAAAAKMTVGEAVEALGARVFEVPGAPGVYVTADEYLSGNVRQKLAQAQEAAATDSRYQRNADALRAVQPEDLAPSQIAATLGMPWIPTDVIEDFGKHLGLESLRVEYTPRLAYWQVEGDKSSAAATSDWGTSKVNATELIRSILNKGEVKVTERERQSDGTYKEVVDREGTEAAIAKRDAIRENFKTWIYGDEERADQLAEIYNQGYNNTVPRVFDGSYLKTPGISTAWKWRPHQQRVVARIIQTGNTYMAHAVGAGKTSAMIGAGMEMRRLGLVKKPMYAVPNHMLGQFTKEFYEQYPTARIAVADERAFHTDRRKQFIADVAMSDLDAVIITHSAFGKIPVSPTFLAQITEKELQQYRDALSEFDPSDNTTRITRKKLEKQIEKLEQRLVARANAPKDQVFTFEEMGVDFLFVDEAHLFRKLDFATKMGSLKGIDPEGSNMSFDLYAKAQYLESMNPGRSLVLASGTPITNTMAELYTLQRFVQPQELEARSLEHFDAWSSAFGESVAAPEQDAAGGYKMVTRFSRFVNLGALSSTVLKNVDVVTSKELAQYVTRPKLKGGGRKMHLAERSDAFMTYQASLADRILAIEARKGPPKPGDDIILSVINDGRHASIDMRLVYPDDPNANGGEKSKLDEMVDTVFDIWKSSKRAPLHGVEDGGGYTAKPIDFGPAAQMIFANLGISGARGFSVVQHIRAQLARRGVPKDEVAFIADHKTHVARQRLFNDMNEGKVRILIGSVAKMGTGVNAQRRLIALHNLDPLWFPADDEQRNGRILRQGNMNPEIEIHDYGLKGSYDSTMWQMMERKGRFIEDFWNGGGTLTEMDDLGEAAFYEQAKALSTADPRVIQLTEMKQDLERLRRRSDAHRQEQHALKRKIQYARYDQEAAEEAIEHATADLAQRIDTKGDAFKMIVGKQEFTKRAEAGEAIMAAVEAFKESPGARVDKEIGSAGGFPIVFNMWKSGTINGHAHWSFTVAVKRNGKRLSSFNVSESAAGTVRSMEAMISGIDHELEQAKRRREQAEHDQASFAKRVGQVFPDERKLMDLEGEVSELTQAIYAPPPAVVQAEETPAAPEGGSMSIAADAPSTAFPSAAVLRAHLSQHPKVGAAVRKLLADGKLVLHDATAPSGRVQGMTDPDGVIHLYARNLGPQTAVPVLLHEAFHAGAETLIGSEAWARTLANVEGVMRRRLAATFYRELNDDTSGSPDFWDKARERLVPGMATAEELAAYAIEERAQAPAGLAERAETLLGKIKAFILRRFGWQAGAVTPAQLEALAVAALRSVPAATPPGGGRRTANAYSVAAATTPAAEAAETHERGVVGHALTKAMSGQYNLLALVPGRALFSELGANLPAGRNYLRVKEEMDAVRSQWHQRADDTAQAWRKLGLRGDGNVKMMEIMHEATLAGADPSKPFASILEDDDRNALMAGKRGQDLDRALARQAEDQGRAKAYADLRKRFKALPEAHQAMFGKVRDEYKALNDEFEATLFSNVEKAMDHSLRKAERDHAEEIERIQDEGLTGRKKDEAVEAADKRLAGVKKRHGWGKRARMTDLRAQFETQRVAEPYFPLARFGQFFVTTRDKETGKVIGFSRFESPRQQAAFAAEQRADKGVAVEVGIIGEVTLREMVDPTFVTDVEGILMAAGVGEGVMDAVWQRWLETMPDLSLRKSRIHRKGTAGYNSDAFRAFGHHMFHGSHQLARLQHGLDLAESLDFAERQAKAADDPVRAGLVVEEMRRRHDFTMNPKGAPWAQTISTAAFVYYLAMSPAAALVNLSQTTIVGTSVLAAYQGGGNGFGVASRHLTRALADFTMGKGWAAQSDRLSADDKAALEEAYRRSTIDSSQAHDLAGVSETGIEYNDLRTKWMSRISFFFHHGERMNREVTFLAAYRMARAKGLEHMPAIEKAADLTWKTHFDYQNTSRPRLMQNDAAKVLLTFRNFSVNLLWRLVRDTSQSLHGASKEERAEARTQLAGITAMMALHAGVRGVWGYALAMTLIGLFLPDGSDDAEDWLKDAVVETLGTTLGGIVLNGVPGHLAGVDLTSRVGMPELWFRSPDRQLEGEDLYHYWLSELLGAGVGMVETGFRGVSMILDGNVYRGIETLMPKAARDLMRASRFAQDGAQTLKGDELLPDMDVGQIIGQALGFTPAQLAERYDQNSHLKNAEMRITDERSTLMGRYSAALRKGERPDEGVIRAIMVFNAENPDYPITAKSLKQSHQARMRSSDRIQGGVSLNPKLAPRLRSEAPTPIYSE